LVFKGQGPDPTGVCNVVNKNPNVNVGGEMDSLSCGTGTNTPCKSLSYAIYGSLDGSFPNPTINLLGTSVLDQNVEITGFYLWIFILIFY
jgi:hypothetical protein